MKNFSVWSRSRLFLPGADPSRSEPESAPGPWRPGAGAGAAQKRGGSATLQVNSGADPDTKLFAKSVTELFSSDQILNKRFVRPKFFNLQTKSLVEYTFCLNTKNKNTVHQNINKFKSIFPSTFLEVLVPDLWQPAEEPP